MPDDTIFEPLAEEDLGATAVRAPATRPKPTPIVPVPEDAPPCNWRPRYGVLAGTWAYYNEGGRLVGYAARVNSLKGGRPDKDVLPITYCLVEDAAGHHYEWCARGLPAPRPLYNLPALLAFPETPVIVCEGEKKADAVAKLFPDYFGTTSMGGARSPKQSNWTPLAGRDVVIWPDHDETGLSYVENVAVLRWQLARHRFRSSRCRRTGRRNGISPTRSPRAAVPRFSWRCWLQPDHGCRPRRMMRRPMGSHPRMYRSAHSG